MHYDYLLVGGGLQSALAALALRHLRPSATMAVVERSPQLGGNHTWSFHAGDVPEDARPWFDPLVQWRWPGYDVIFPKYRRHLSQPYGAFTGLQLDEVVRAAFSPARGCDIISGAEVVRASEEGIALADGRSIEARVVIDGRGPERSAIPSGTGYQKFLGLELRLESPHGLQRPILMDTLVPQIGGMRFFYVLPFEADRVLVEDTYFTNDAELDNSVLRARIASWIADRGWQVAEVLREEQGVLPMPYEPSENRPDSVRLCGGYAGGWFNPATGYSLPLAVRFARFVAQHDSEQADEAALATLVTERDRQKRFLLLLNRLLFEAVPPEARRNVFERFYRLPADCIARFYSMRLRPDDQVRILLGRPPQGISLGKAFKALGEWGLSAQWFGGTGCW
jgi:lycopene beta-cyclase